MKAMAWSEEPAPLICGALSPDGVDTCAKEVLHHGWCSNGNLEWLDNAWNVSAYDQTQEAPPLAPQEIADPKPPRPEVDPAPSNPGPALKLGTIVAAVCGLVGVGAILGHQIKNDPVVVKSAPVTTTATIERPARVTTTTSVATVTSTATSTATATVTATSEVVRTEILGAPRPVPITAVPIWCRVVRNGPATQPGLYTGLCQLDGYDETTFFQSYDPFWRMLNFPWAATDGQDKYVHGNIFEYSASEDRWKNCQILNCVAP